MTRTNLAWRCLASLVVAIAGTLFFDDLAYATAPTVTSFSPTSGTIGTQVTVTGSGFSGATALKFNGAAATTFNVNSATKITATAPTTVSTGMISVTTAGGTGKSTNSFTVTVGAQLSPALGRPLSTLTVSGAGFNPSKPVDVYFDTTDLALAVTTAKGLVSLQMPAPASAQPGTHWVTLVERGSDLAVQKPFTVQTNWPMAGFVPQRRGYNPLENTISASNAAQLTDSWTTQPFSIFSNATPLVVVGGNAFVVEVQGGIHAYSSTGALLWTAAIGSNLPPVAPVGFNGKVFFGDQTGNVYAFNMACRKDGGVCTPIWTQSVGTHVTGGMTLFNGLLYVPSNDSTVHVFNPATGAAGTPISGGDTTHGSVTTPVTFTSNGGFFYGTGNFLHFSLAGSSQGTVDESATVSPIAAYNGLEYFTTSDAKLHEFQGNNWTATLTGSTGCAPAPVVANNVVYAAGCTSIGAFNAGSGASLWSITTASFVSGLSIANGVLYACANDVLTAYNAASGGQVWSGGSCDGAVEIVNGTVYRANITLTTYNLPGGGPDKVAARPAPHALRPDYRLLRQPYRAFNASASEE